MWQKDKTGIIQEWRGGRRTGVIKTEKTKLVTANLLYQEGSCLCEEFRFSWLNIVSIFTYVGADKLQYFFEQKIIFIVVLFSALIFTQTYLKQLMNRKKSRFYMRWITTFDYWSDNRQNGDFFAHL